MRREEVAQRLLGEGMTEAGRIRAARYTAFIRKLFGSAPPSAPVLDSQVRASWPSLRMSAQHRSAVEETAKVVAVCLARHELEKVVPLLAREVWMVWGDGALRCHPALELLQSLSERKATSVWAIPQDVRTYTWAELRSQLPRPAASLLDAVFGLSGTMLCAMRLDTPRDPVGRIMLALAPARHGWRALTLPMPSIDTAIAASRHSFDEDWLRFGDKLVRQLLLHNTNGLRSLRNHMMDRIFFRDAAVEAEQMIEQTAAKDPPVEHLDLAFLGAREERYDAIDQLAGRPLLRELDRRAKEIWRASIDDLRPKLTVVELGQVEPKSQAPQPSGSAIAMMVRRIERDQRNEEIERWRMAGVFACSLALASQFRV